MTWLVLFCLLLLVPGIAECIFRQVMLNKLAGMEFLDVATRGADQQNATNMQEFITAMRAEIELQSK